MPMAMLEDVLVPVYFYHRYQVEAATKVVGGMFYNYSLRGDGQIITKSLSKQEQLTALNAIIDCIDPKFLRLPDQIAQIIHHYRLVIVFQENFLEKNRSGI
jgi:hypothetical protein